MKKTLANIRILAALLIASAAFAACTSEDSAIIDNAQPAAQQAPQKYTLTLQAGKADVAQTRALKLETMGDLTAYWADGDEVTVTKGETALGTLSVKEGSVSADGQTCTFTGELTGTVSTGDVLTLTYHPMASLAAFGSQNGQLVSAAACDMATASVTVTAVDDGTKTITVGTAKFKTQTAMLKITLQDTGGHDLNASSLTISAGGTEIFTLTSIAVVGTLYLALPSAATVAAATGMTTDALAAATITFTAKVGDDTYVATKAGYPFAAGKYYQSTVKMAKGANLAYLTANYEAKDGETLTGKLANKVQISIAAGATVTLKDVDINADEVWTDGQFAGITCAGTAIIILEGTNTVKGFNAWYSGINVPKNETLTIKGTGTLNVSSGIELDSFDGHKFSLSAGIGANNGGDCGNIVIEGGTITATGANGSAGIGGSYVEGGDQKSCGNITISGGTIIAMGGEGAAGIGGGHAADGAHSDCGNIEISGGTITATGGSNAAGIGGGYAKSDEAQTNCGTITIKSTVTQVTATKGTDAPNSIGAGKASDEMCTASCGTVTIEDPSKVTQN